jgi:hypothetical protein
MRWKEAFGGEGSTLDSNGAEKKQKECGNS